MFVCHRTLTIIEARLNPINPKKKKRDLWN